ncbi:jg21004, partial [Pararge aegeria aegeria]
RKFLREPVFKDRYIDFMREYERLGHMTENKASANSCADTINYYLPHHSIVRESSLTTKQRTVFDASSPSSSGLSLNDIQMVGPTVQEDLYSILLRFRQHKYIVTGDIEKMYRAIELNPTQRSLQQIIFRYDPSEPLKTFTLNTLTYGTASAPYLATKCLVSLASSPSDISISRSIQRDFYVDDYLGGASTIDETIRICKGVIDTLKSAQFNLRKLKSNKQVILESIVPLYTESGNVLEISNSKNNKTLGLNWICDLDILSFSINIELHDTITKRHVLSVISQIFDPLGLVGPCIVEAKIIMQRLWIEQCSWDEEVSKEIQQSWMSFAKTLPILNNLKIPRWILNDDIITHEVHVFSDSSERAYGACLYVRSVSKSNLISVHLLTSKSRVAPIKPTTIPRLELCGSLLAARLCKKVLHSLTFPIEKCRFWCDSMIVLGWLKTPSTRLKSFVRNRVHEIQDSTKGHTWNYVPSKDNPADLLSRGLKADHISNSRLWWSGPTFLANNESEWPKVPNTNVNNDLPEIITCNLMLDVNPNANLFTDLIKNKSNLTKLKNIIGYIIRFIYNCKNNAKRSGYLTTQELQTSLNLIIHKAQLDMFPDEYEILKAGKTERAEVVKFLVKSDLQNQIAQEGIEFKFVPAYTPHFNGLAEAAVHSTKHHLKRLLQTTHLTYEEMATCLAQIEAVLNSRPLTPISSNPNDFTAITPAHFLIGRSLTSIPHPHIPDDANVNRLERYKRDETIKQHFWRRFSVEYIGLLQKKVKWTSSRRELKVGALVLIKEKALPPLLWSMGRIINVYPGSDGVARVAEIKTQRGTIRRAFNNICPFPEG